MAIVKPRICAVITTNELISVKTVEPLVDLYEVRIDLIGDGWRRMVKHLEKPWIACNRAANEGGMWAGNEETRLQELLEAVTLGASIVDIELETENLDQITKACEKAKVKRLISHHDLERTPPSSRLRAIVQREIDAGGDICKLVTTAGSFADSVSLLQLFSEFPKVKMVAFAMGPLGVASRILCPLVGGDFTYAAVNTGMESAAGQLTVDDLTMIYGMLRDDKKPDNRKD